MRLLISATLLAVALPCAAGAAPEASSRPVGATPLQTEAPSLSLDTPIAKLVADPAAKGLLDRELPGLTTHAYYEQFKGLTLKALQPMSGGLISDDRLKAVEAGLKALNATVAR
ncbi:hypothetical protein [Caulobacter mirabilis]|uniref:DUF885 domain-containing protein n=1 Tax=Caulobacter mirabilis TaxID=69666 RepID=A0A2D2B0W4_9CAUL|nr:hypothetical protein [Caulobacter mirabilis]ATQ43885.1 hypothetical protein CSW64_16515 [Caulobacter mirabilis]